MELDEFELNYKSFLNQSTLIFGESGSGKSTVIVDILYQLKPFVEQIVVFCPTDLQNHTYDKIVPRPFIHYDVSTRVIAEMWERQLALTDIYNRAQNPITIERLFNHAADPNVKQVILQLDTKLAECDTESARERLNEFKMMVWKRTINNHRYKFSNKKLTADEEHTLKYLDLNPHIVMIFDDCTEQLRKLSKDPFMQKMFFQGRHEKVTFIIACHDDTVIPPGLRDGAFMRLYMTEGMARKSLLRDTARMDRDIKQKRINVIKSAFTPLAKYQKLAYVRNSDTFYCFTAKPRKDFTFCSPIIWRYCDMIKANPADALRNNVYMKNFI